MPQPPPAQPAGEAHRISLEPPATLGRDIANFTTLGAASYLTFRRDVNQYEVGSDSTDSHFRTNVQADIFTTVIVPKGLSNHLFIDVEHIRMHPAKYPGAIELIESSGLAAPFAFHCDYNAAAIHQFYATCHFGSDNTVSWITSDVRFKATYATFVAALGFPNSGYKIHKDDPNHAPKTIDVCGHLLKPLRELDADERLKDLNQCSQTHDVVSRLVSSQNALKARLRASGALDVSDDEAPPAAPSIDFGFPSGPEWSEFFDEAGGSVLADDADDDGDEP
ncbi:hypothetical protein ZWY2020_058433 [Hordeum vulgare]|nr:hypothetical protein ZWY2020_058433 [Hordeum vulgare]